ncbi:MAG: acyltransferase [Flavobacterium sp.]|nr:MAG: acyltransferase [Flavobacterium sp.]
MKILGKLFVISKKVILKLLMYTLRPLFKKCGKNVTFTPTDRFSFSTISLGDDVFIGPGANFSAIKSIEIGNKVMFGPNVTIMGGDHNTSVVGEYMFDIEDKLPENDLPVIIKDDVWVGTGAIILKGITIGTGSIIAAGALVTRNVEEYSIYGGIPAKFIKKRFPEAELLVHIQKMNERANTNKQSK